MKVVAIRACKSKDGMMIQKGYRNDGLARRFWEVLRNKDLHFDFAIPDATGRACRGGLCVTCGAAFALSQRKVSGPPGPSHARLKQAYT